MFCKNCGTELRANAKFCASCGTKVRLREVEPSASELDSLESTKETPEVTRKTIADVSSSIASIKSNVLEKKDETLEKLKQSEVAQNFNEKVEKSATANNGSPNHFFYVVDFFKKMFRVKNTGVIVYLLINLIIITVTFYYLLDGEISSIIPAFLLALMVYVFSLAIALSPIGEWILRLQAGGRKIKRQEQLDYLMPIFDEVYKKAKEEDPTISDKVKLYIADDNSYNACAVGRKTIVVTRGLLELKPEKIAATLAHEFGHISHHDTDTVLLVHVGNFVVAAIILGVRLAIDIAHLMANFICIFFGGAEGAIGLLVGAFYRVMADITVGVLVWLWGKLGDWLVKRSMRNNEFEADQFACDLGYGYSLCEVLELVDGGEATKGFFAALSNDHPAVDDRIVRMQNYGVEYSAANMYGQV